MATKQVEHHDDVLAMFSNGPIKQLGERNQSNVAQRGRMEMASQVTASMEHEIRATLDAFDNEGTGTFDVSELVQISVALGEPLSHDECIVILQDIDPEGTGVVSFEVFIKWWRCYE